MFQKCFAALALLACFMPIIVHAQEEYHEVVIDGVTWLFGSDGSRALLDSETGFAQVEFNGELVTTKVPTPARRLRAMPILNPKNYARYRNRVYGGMMAANKKYFGTRVSDGVLVAGMLLSNESQIENLKITDEQLVQLKSMVNEFRSRLDEHPMDIDGSEDDLAYARLHRRAAVEEYSMQMSEVFADEQLQKMSRWSPARIGVVKALTETPLGESLELTDGQKEQIRTRVDDVIERLKSELDRARTKILEEVGDALDEGQREKLDKHLGDLLKQQIENSSTETLIKSLDYDLKESKKNDDF